MVFPSTVLYTDIHKECVIAIGLPIRLPYVLRSPFFGDDLYTFLKGLL